jgi:hypothetical protein
MKNERMTELQRQALELNQRDITVDSGFEVVNESDIRSVTDRLRSLLRRDKKLHIVILERP